MVPDGVRKNPNAHNEPKRNDSVRSDGPQQDFGGMTRKNPR
jgi:hypothetical protein